MLLGRGRLRFNRRNINHYYEIYHLLIRIIPLINTRYILYCHEIFDDKSTWIVAGSVIASCANVASIVGGTDWKCSARVIVKNWGGHYSSDRFPVWVAKFMTAGFRAGFWDHHGTIPTPFDAL